MKVKFISLASGSSGNCYYIGTEKYGILIDAGIAVRTIKKSLKEVGVGMETIRAVFVTHDHADHIKAVGGLGEKLHIPVYTTARIHEGINKSYCMTEKLHSSVRYLEKEEPMVLEDFHIESFEVPHDGTDNVGYCIEIDGKVFSFLTDLGEITPTAAKFIRKANYLILEANYDDEMLRMGTYPQYLKERITSRTGHMSNIATAEFLAENITEDLKYIWHPCSQMKDYEELPPIVIDHGKGVYLYDKSGKKYIDIVSSWWCNLLGHCNPDINQGIKEQLDKLEHVIFANFTHEGAISLCEQLSDVIPPGLSKFNFSDNGSAAVECSLKMAFQYQYQTGHPEKTRFMCLSDGYHGETIGALSVGTLDLYAKIYQPMLLNTIRIQAPDCYRCPFEKSRNNCKCECFKYAEDAFEQYADETCAMIVEPLLQGSAGMKIYPPLYLKKLRALCDKYNVLLIADEIATGFGRTGKMFAFEHAGVSPDIMCISKGLTGGYMPMAITITTDNIYNAFYDDYSSGKAFMHSHTYSGNPLGCAAALSVLKIFREQPILKNASKTARYLNSRLNEKLGNHKNIGEIRSIGLINAIELVTDKKYKTPFDSSLRIGYQIYKEALKLGLILRPLGNVLYFNPPLNISKDEIDRSIEICLQSINIILN